MSGATTATYIVMGVMAAASAASAYMQSEAQRAQTNAQSEAAKSNAIAMSQQADIERQKGEVDKRRIDMERDKLRRDYEAQAGANRSLLASGNLDMTSGSAADSLLGNALLFGDDMAANRYNFELASWEAGDNARKAGWQSDTYSAQSSWLNKSAGSVGDSLLSAGIAGGQSLGSSYLMGGFKGMGAKPGVNKNPYWGANPVEPY